LAATNLIFVFLDAFFSISIASSRNILRYQWLAILPANWHLDCESNSVAGGSIEGMVSNSADFHVFISHRQRFVAKSSRTKVDVYLTAIRVPVLSLPVVIGGSRSCRLDGRADCSTNRVSLFIINKPHHSILVD
jgi:hypothetical protein